jgi:hypothetical protein
MLKVIARENMVSLSKNRILPLFPAFDPHRVLSHEPAHQGYRENHYEKNYGQNDLGDERTQTRAERKPESGERFEKRRVGHGYEQKGNGQ